MTKEEFEKQKPELAKKCLENMRKNARKIQEYDALKAGLRDVNPQNTRVAQYCKKVYGEGTYADQIVNILTHFDFVKVHQVVGFLNRKWAKTDGEQVTGEVPTMETLKERAKELLLAAVGRPGGRILQGGFIAMNINGTLTLTFELETYTGE